MNYKLATAKAAVAHLVQCASVQLAATNIRVNAIAPGLVRTSLFYTSSPQGDVNDHVLFSKDDALRRYDAVAARLQQSGRQYYYNRAAEPVEIANIGVFLASDAAASINGQTIVADSGRIAGGFAEKFLEPVATLKPLTKL